MARDVIIVNDRKEFILSSEIWKSTVDYSLFHITPVRTISDKTIFGDCSFMNLFIDHKTDWGAPIPSTFQRFFSNILELIVPGKYILLLNVVDYINEDYFQQHHFVETFLKPNGHRFFFLPREINGEINSSVFFECPIPKISVLEDIAFPGTFTHVEGFVLDRYCPNSFLRWAQMDNTDVMFRDMLTSVYLAFGVWGDHNGMFVATDKFDVPKLRETLRNPEIQQDISNYISLAGGPIYA